MSTKLVETITDRASASFPYILTKENFDEIWPIWRTHWIETGEKFYDEIFKEGLTETAKSIRQHIDFNKRWWF